MENVKYPINMVGVNLTYKCNLKCYMCGQRNLDLGIQKQEVDYDTLCRFIDILKPYGLRFGVYLWGGEPFLYSKIFELVEFIHSKGLFVTVNTNGTMLEQYAEDIIKSRIDRLIISIDGLEEVHDDIRGVKGTFKRVIDGINKINSLKRFRPFLNSNTVISSKNYHQLFELIMYLKSLRLSSMELQLPMFFTEEMGNEYELRMKTDFNVDAHSWKGFVGDYHEIDIPLLISQLERIQEAIPRHLKLVPGLNKGQIAEYFTIPKAAFTNKMCNLPFSQIGVEPNGDLVICPDFPDYVVGNIYNVEKVSDFWDSEKMRTFRNSLSEKGLLPICSKCCQLYQF